MQKSISYSESASFETYVLIYISTIYQIYQDITCPETPYLSGWHNDFNTNCVPLSFPKSNFIIKFMLNFVVGSCTWIDQIFWSVTIFFRGVFASLISWCHYHLISILNLTIPNLVNNLTCGLSILDVSSHSKR